MKGQAPQAVPARTRQRTNVSKLLRKSYWDVVGELRWSSSAANSLLAPHIMCRRASKQDCRACPGVTSSLLQISHAHPTSDHQSLSQPFDVLLACPGDMLPERGTSKGKSGQPNLPADGGPVVAEKLQVSGGHRLYPGLLQGRGRELESTM